MTDKRTRTAAQRLRKRAGSKPGKARFAKLTAEERREVARKAAEGRWGPKEGQETTTDEDVTLKRDL